MSFTIVETTSYRLGDTEAMARPYPTAWAHDPRYPPRDPALHPSHFHTQPPQDIRFPPPPVLARAPDNYGPPEVQPPQQARFPSGYHSAAMPAPSPHISYSQLPPGPPPSRHNSVISTSQQRHHGHHVTQNPTSMVHPTAINSSQAYQRQLVPRPLQEHAAPRSETSASAYLPHPPVPRRTNSYGTQRAPPPIVTMPPMPTLSSPAMSPSENRSDPMRIADILSVDGGSNNSTNSMSAPSSRRPSHNLDAEYKLKIRQQPVAARSCGFGERDRRVIDPPPIVQLLIESPYLSEEETKKRLRYCHYVMSCSIYDESGTRDAAFMPEEYRQQRRLMGSLAGAPFVGKDEFGEEGCFFCFPDLSCRTPGAFRLKFSLVMIDPVRAREVRHFPVLVEVKSKVFHVYSAKDFPGMQASTELTKRLKEQGCIISIKKGANEKGKSARLFEDSSEEDEGSRTSQSRKQRRLSRR
ncbi:velvet factor-domain-containing protein [Thelonectria olida]|uniref:Velvet factor-domain-containing protein n=1 Tax=Thelonectria olida TaxID=1576542 RepID=A0A9P8W2S1_9HYPO|nr:velvet factor-domain-containing protein [Thelonectria olida]